MKAAIICLLLLPYSLQSQRVVDQIVALVNNDIITQSDLLWSLALNPDAPNPAGHISSDVLRQKLEVMIDEVLVRQEASRIPTAEISQKEINEKRALLISKFPNEAVFRERVGSVGLTLAKIDELIRQRILIEKFIDFRFRSFAFVSAQEVQRYYDERLVPEVRKRGQTPPPLDQVREQITEILREQKVNEALDKWLSEIRQRATIVQLVDL
jgi:parvulin-like peptidyl-prolyl isomerase